MDRAPSADPPLRERKRQRARAAITEAAHALFDEKGFDAVTVADIAARAEVGRATFFRYFGDKQEVVFDGSPRPDAAALAGLTTAEPEGPIGDSLPRALDCVRAAAAALSAQLAADPVGYARHERLVASAAELQGRSLVKQRGYADAMAELLHRWGADPETARLAAEVGLACVAAGRADAAGDAERLPGAVDAAFARLLGRGR
ncbi:TetR/AcrR family transcriptional regulator [Nocardiopsis coralliicola]